MRVSVDQKELSDSFPSVFKMIPRFCLIGLNSWGYKSSLLTACSQSPHCRGFIPVIPFVDCFPEVLERQLRCRKQTDSDTFAWEHSAN